MIVNFCTSLRWNVQVILHNSQYFDRESSFVLCLPQVCAWLKVSQRTWKFCSMHILTQIWHSCQNIFTKFSHKSSKFVRLVSQLCVIGHITAIIWILYEYCSFLIRTCEVTVSNSVNKWIELWLVMQLHPILSIQALFRMQFLVTTSFRKLICPFHCSFNSKRFQNRKSPHIYTKTISARHSLCYVSFKSDVTKQLIYHSKFSCIQRLNLSREVISHCYFHKFCHYCVCACVFQLPLSFAPVMQLRCKTKCQNEYNRTTGKANQCYLMSTKCCSLTTKYYWNTIRRVQWWQTVWFERVHKK